MTELRPSFDSCKTTEELMGLFKNNLNEALSTLKCRDEDFAMREWTFTREGQVVLAAPRIVAIRSFQLNPHFS
ncbi:MAG: hypothetical protein D6719_05065 [Candidatus Dadabacteria bacterium]|nr:MAG: hypothetical protein D6719_05065 [Candidatus Dadabacteria bacterium]